MNNNKHITQSELISFQQEFMTTEEKEAFLEHICSCNYCSEQLAAFMAEEIIPAPRDMKENILKATKRPEVQLAIKSREASKQLQLFIYSLKVGTAAVGAILLLFLTMNSANLKSTTEFMSDINLRQEESVSFTDTIRDGMNTISKSMLDFSNNIIKMEVTDNDQKEK